MEITFMGRQRVLEESGEANTLVKQSTESVDKPGGKGVNAAATSISTDFTGLIVFCAARLLGPLDQ
jgi:hypothetical protein